MDFKNRIVGNGEMRAADFLANPLNWRIHPKPQQEALSGVLDEVGWVQQVVVNKQTGNLVDGHLRVMLALREGDDTPVPVVYVDLTPEEEALILATLDPLSAMAAVDKEKLDELLKLVDIDNEAVEDLLDSLLTDETTDQTLEELDVDNLPDNPLWVLMTIPLDKIPDIVPMLDEIEKLGVRIEKSNR